MRKTIILLAAFGFTLANAPSVSAISTDEHSQDEVCLTWINLGHGCAYGQLGHKDKTANCSEDGCDVTVTYRLVVTPAACGRLGNVKTDPCAYSAPRQVSYEETVRLPYGRFVAEADLCVAAEPTFTAELCTELTHVIVVEHPSRNPQQLAANLGGLLGLGDGRGGLVLSTENVEIYEGGCLVCAPS